MARERRGATEWPEDEHIDDVVPLHSEFATRHRQLCALPHPLTIVALVGSAMAAPFLQSIEPMLGWLALAPVIIVAVLSHQHAPALLFAVPVFATRRGLRFQWRGRWQEVEWKDVGELRGELIPHWWRAYRVELLDGRKPKRIHFLGHPRTRDLEAELRSSDNENGGRT